MFPHRLALILAIAIAAPANADCADDAGEYHHVSPWILRAFAQVETGSNPNTTHVNANGTVDIGLTGINEVHLPTLARYGATREDLYDPCVSFYTSAWLLRKKIDKYGNTWFAVGSYNYDGTKYPERRDNYANKVRAVISEWKKKGLIAE